MSPRLVTVFMSCFVCGLGWQGGGGWPPGMVLACAGRVARPTIASMETQTMMLAARSVFASSDGRCVIFLPSIQLVVRRTAIASALHRPAQLGLGGETLFELNYLCLQGASRG